MVMLGSLLHIYCVALAVGVSLPPACPPLMSYELGAMVGWFSFTKLTALLLEISYASHHPIDLLYN